MDDPKHSPSIHPVSVVIPTFNRMATICDAIDSALQQTYPIHEVVVVDDGSTDGTAERLESRYASEPRVRYLAKTNAGPGPARNMGIRESTGDLIAFLDSDDLWMPEKLALQIEQLDREPEAALCFCDRVLGSADASETSRFLATGFEGDTSMRGLIERNIPICTPSVVLRRRALEPVGLFDETFICAQDWDLWIRVRARYPITFVNRPLVIIRTQKDSISRTRVLDKWTSWLRLWKKHEEMFVASGCPRSLVRTKQTHAHKKIAQTLHSLGRYSEARPHYIEWWRNQPWQIRPIIWWVSLPILGGLTGRRISGA